MLPGQIEEKKSRQLRRTSPGARLIDVHEFSRLTSLTVGTIYQLHSQGRLDGLAVKVGRLLRFDRERLEAAIQSGAVAQPGNGQDRGDSA
jgi:excisionase family DNA binding protein